MLTQFERLQVSNVSVIDILILIFSNSKILLYDSKLYY